MVMNNYSSLHHVKFQSREDTCKLAKPGSWWAKVDIQSPYYSVAIHHDDNKVTGLKWKFSGQHSDSYVFYTRLLFDARQGPARLHCISQTFHRYMHRRGYKDLVVYADDFLIVAPTYDMCNDTLHVLMRMLKKLGFSISWPKVLGPIQQITVQGININTVDCSISLGPDKLNKLNAKLDKFWAHKQGLWCCQRSQVLSVTHTRLSCDPEAYS